MGFRVQLVHILANQSSCNSARKVSLSLAYDTANEVDFLIQSPLQSLIAAPKICSDFGENPHLQ